LKEGVLLGEILEYGLFNRYDKSLTVNSLIYA